jgi:exodeoxyribonuclease VII small subunit
MLKSLRSNHLGVCMSGTNPRGSDPETLPPPAAPSFETALSRLEEIVHRLERGEISLDESLTAFREGSDLVKFCLDRLTAAEKAVQELVVGENGGLSVRPRPSDESTGDASDA